MRKKIKTAIVRAEVLPPSRTLSEADFKRMVAEAIEQRVTEAMHASEANLEPWFQPKEVSYEIKRRQTRVEQQKWSLYYSDWGCILCGTKEKPHCTLGFCYACHSRTRQRLTASMRRHAPAPSVGNLGFMDTVRMAREALAPALKTLPARDVTRRKQKS